MSENKPIIMTMPERLKIARNGQWLGGEVLITHRGVLSYLNKNLEYCEEHKSYIVRQRNKAVLVELEDTAAVVTSVKIHSEKLSLLLANGQTAESSQLELAYCEDGGAYYAKIDFLGRSVWARLLSAALQGLSTFITDKDGVYYLSIAGNSFEIKQLYRCSLKQI